jgi:hypothetical protein
LPELQHGRLPYEFEGRLWILNTREIHDDPVFALALDDRLYDPILIDAITEDGYQSLYAIVSYRDLSSAYGLQEKMNPSF